MIASERRSEYYSFLDRESLLQFFSIWMTRQQLMSIIEEAEQTFIERQNSTRDETELQFVKKCEYAAVRHLKSIKRRIP